jgi:hypothetical protein
MKVYCKNCAYISHRGGAINGSRTCSEVKEDTFYAQKEGDPSIINAKNDCEHFKHKKQKQKTPWHKYWFSSPWWGM